MSEPLWKVFDSAEAFSSALALRIENLLGQSIAERGTACAALAGGSTPVAAYELLGQAKLAWENVTILPTDERWVPMDDPLRNEAMLRGALPEAARYVSLSRAKRRDESISSPSLEEITQELASVAHGIDVVVLGMGEDGHTASLFPDDPDIEALMRTDQPVGVARPPSQPTARVTLSASRLARCRVTLLALRGEKKRAVLERALAGENLPIGRVLRTAPQPVEIYYAP